MDIVGDGSSDDKEVPKVDKPLTGEPTPAADAESSSSVSTPDERGVVGAEDDDFFRLPDEIFGRHLSIEMHSIHKTVGLRVRCCNPGHEWCSRYKSYGSDVSSQLAHSVRYLETWQS